VVLVFLLLRKNVSSGLQLAMGEEIQTIQQGEADRIEIETENPEPRGPAGSGKGAMLAGKTISRNM
jgi:hypothetical protein